MMSQAAAAPAPGAVHRIERIRAALDATPLSIVQLLARIGVAAVFFKSGMTKIASWEFTLMLFREEEGTTCVLPPEAARALGCPDAPVFRRITLGVLSSLEAVGLTAAVATALTAAGISANVVAAFHHDHVFVPADRAADAMACLTRLSAHAP